MKKLLLTLLSVLAILPLIARDFQYTYEGQTLTYTVISEEDKTCMTKEGEAWNTSGNQLSGILVIPSVVKDASSEYKVTEIGDFGFFYCSGLTSVDIPLSITTIGESAFEECSGLTKVDLPSSLVEIGSRTFCECSGLTAVTIPSSVTFIGELAFHGCSGLTKIDVPSSVTEIGVSAFYGENLREINVEAGNQNYSSVDGVLFNKDQTAIIQYPACKKRNYNIPSSVMTIGDFAFAHCSFLSAVTIPSSVTTIGTGAFERCSKLTTVDIPSGVTAINDLTFSGCTGLTTLVLPPSLTTIGYCSFSGCTGLTTLVLPPSLTTIGYNAFGGCSGLTTVKIPSSVTAIEERAFIECPLTSVYYDAENPIEGSESIFFGLYYSATLYVPACAVEKCMLIEPWKYFYRIEAYEFDGIKDVDTDIDNNHPCDVYTLDGKKVATSTDDLAPGIYIIRQGDKAKKIAVQ